MEERKEKGSMGGGGGAGRGIPTHGTLRASLVATVHIRTKKYKSQSAGMSIKG